MPYKNTEDKLAHDKKYSKEYYEKNREERLEYRKSRRREDNENWRRWYRKKKRRERKAKIRLGGVYKRKNPYSNR